jgi:hypothetical protein
VINRYLLSGFQQQEEEEEEQEGEEEGELPHNPGLAFGCYSHNY